MALVLRTITALSGEDPASERVAKAHGFSLHAGVGCEAHRRDVRERLCRYIARPAVAAARGRGGGNSLRCRVLCGRRKGRGLGKLADRVSACIQEGQERARPSSLALAGEGLYL